MCLVSEIVIVVVIVVFFMFFFFIVMISFFFVWLRFFIREVSFGKLIVVSVVFGFGRISVFFVNSVFRVFRLIRLKGFRYSIDWGRCVRFLGMVCKVCFFCVRILCVSGFCLLVKGGSMLLMVRC